MLLESDRLRATHKTQLREFDNIFNKEKQRQFSKPGMNCSCNFNEAQCSLEHIRPKNVICY